MGETPDNLQFSAGTTNPRHHVRRRVSHWWWSLPLAVILIGSGVFVWLRYYRVDETFVYTYTDDSSQEIHGGLEQLLLPEAEVQKVFPQFSLSIATVLDAEEARAIFGSGASVNTIAALRGLTSLWESNASAMTISVVEFPSDMTAHAIFSHAVSATSAKPASFGTPIANPVAINVGDEAAIVFSTAGTEGGAPEIRDGVSAYLIFRVRNSVQTIAVTFRENLPRSATDESGQISGAFTSFLETQKANLTELAQRAVMLYVAYTPDPTVGTDTDGDGLSNDVEAQLGTNPSNPDTDGDGFTDRQEVENGYDPLTPA